jgi:hypothetical protein
MREREMAKYLARGKYVGDGIKGVMTEGAPSAVRRLRRLSSRSAERWSASTTHSAKSTYLGSSTSPMTPARQLGR